MKIVTLFGIDIRINLWLLAFLGIAVLAGILWDVAILFGVVFLHEMAHALVARFFHARVKSVELFPLGGVAHVESYFELYPKAEILIALAGPLFNFILAVLTAAYFYFFQTYNDMGQYFLQCNLLIGTFNLIPAMPLDGGRILRSILSNQVGIRQATQISLGLGHILALGILTYGLYLAIFDYLVNITILCTPLFLWLTIRAEGKKRNFILMKQWVGKEDRFKKAGSYPVYQLALPCQITIASAVKGFLPRRYHMITLLDEHMNVCGTLSEQDIMQGWMTYGGEVSLSKILRLH